MPPLATLLLCLIPLSAVAQTDPTPRMQQIVNSYVGDKTFMGTVLVVKEGHTLIDQATAPRTSSGTFPTPPPPSSASDPSLSSSPQPASFYCKSAAS
jgi:hypothetical protein